MKFSNEKHIDQIYSDRTNTWSFRVRVKGVSKTFSEKDFLDASTAFKAAKRYRNELLTNDAIVKVVGTQKKVEEVFEETFDLIPCREQTKKRMTCTYNKFIHLDKKIINLNQEDIMMTLNNMIEVASDDTIKRAFYIMKRIVKVAIIKEYITKDITLGITCPKSHFLGQPRAEKITDKQTLVQIANLCETYFISPYDKKQYPLMIWFLYYTGCRPCEMFAILKTDIHDGYLTINKEIGSSLTENHVVRQCKTPLSNRNIPIVPELKDVIVKAMELSKCDILFPTKDNEYNNSTYVGGRFKKMCDKHNISFNMYQIRHLFSTDLGRSNVDPRTHQELMGHKYYSTSVDYMRSNDQLKKDALQNR